MSPLPPGRSRLAAVIALVAALAGAVSVAVHQGAQRRRAEDALAAERARGLYERARLAQGQGDYNAAREAFLAVLRAAPRHAEARAALVELTAGAGVTEEARHHLAELEKIVPAADARLARWRAFLAER